MVLGEIHDIGNGTVYITLVNGLPLVMYYDTGNGFIPYDDTGKRWWCLHL